MTPEQKGSLPLRVEKLFLGLQDRIFSDVVRRIKKTGEITSTADYQINKLLILGNSTEFIESEIKRLTGLTNPEIWELYDKVANWEYVRYADAYEQINGHFTPLEDNEQIQQWSQAIVNQTKNEIQNITKSLGMSVDIGGGKMAFTPLAEYYQKYLDRACMDIVTGAFDYNTVLRRVVKEMTSSGIRSVDYASGWNNRVPVAVRRAVMTGVSQLSAQINEMVAKDLGTDEYEVTWHSGHRLSHWWGGRVYTYQELQAVCHLGEGDGLCGWNCRHSYFAFVPGIYARIYTDEQLAELEKQEQEIKTYQGKEYNKYQASQMQRKLETKMRAQRAKVKQLQQGGADQNDIIAAKARYLNTLHQYQEFSKKMGLPEQMERVYIDGLGRIAPGKYIDISAQRDIIKEKKVLESKTYSSAIKAEEKKIYKDNVETAVLFDSRGNVLFRESSGASNYVKFSKEQLSRMKGATLTHNHPSSSTFSPADVSIMTEQGLNVIRATSTSKTYQLKKLNGAEVNHDFSIDYEKAMSDNKKITDKDFRKYEKERKQGKISPLEYQDKINALNKKWNDLNSDWLKKNSKKYGYKYGVIERGK